MGHAVITKRVMAVMASTFVTQRRVDITMVEANTTGAVTQARRSMEKHVESGMDVVFQLMANTAAWLGRLHMEVGTHVLTVFIIIIPAVQ